MAVKNPTTRILSHPHRQHYYPQKYQQIKEEKLKSNELINQNKKIFNSNKEENKQYFEKNLKIKNNHFPSNLQNKNYENLKVKNQKLQKQKQILPLLSNLCESSLTNPCKNNGTCLWNENTGKYFCKCTNEYVNENCSKRIDFTPCTQIPCLNGATCSVIGDAEHIDFDCFCTSGYAGKRCEFKPCEQNPCKNGGTCRTTRSAALFFCACSPSWGGKTCLISLPPIEENDEYWESTALNSNFTQQLSSGKIEWIEQLKKITPTKFNETEINTNLFEQLIGEEIPIRTLKNSTTKNSAISLFFNKEKIKIILILLFPSIIKLFFYFLNEN